MEDDHAENNGQEEKLPAYEPGPDAIDITPSLDGGVLKEIKRHGVGEAHPLAGDKVSVHYVGTLTDGTKFDSSRDRGEYFDFNLGKGSVIKAWDLGVATMKKGELAVLLCKSEYAYGKTGSPPKIPADATLVFEVELFDWKGEDVSENKDGGVLKSELKQGEGYQNPKDGATCEIHIIGRVGETEFDNRDVTFVIGEGSEVGLVEGVEQAMKKMKKNETARVIVKAKYGYGAEGNSQLGIPPHSDLEFEIELKKFEKSKESWELEPNEKLEQSEICKNKGTEFFKAGKFKIAVKYYKRIIEYLKNEDSMKDEDGEKRTSLLLAANLNQAMCYLKLKEDVEAANSCDDALALDPKNEKGLFRRGTANLNLQNFDKALTDFRAVLEVDPENKAAKNQIVITNQKIKQAHEREKKTYAGMFQKFAAADSKKATPEVVKDSEKQQQPEEKELSNGTESENSPSEEPMVAKPEMTPTETVSN